MNDGKEKDKKRDSRLFFFPVANRAHASFFISHFQVAPSFGFKARLNAKPFSLLFSCK